MSAPTGEQPTVRELVARLKDAGHPCTLLGIGPVSELTVEAALEVCREQECPCIFIASRNQVESRELGYGYLMGGMDQQGFIRLIRRKQREAGYRGPLYVCRDHGGPWQRNAELESRLPVAEAMELAQRSFAADIRAGFNYLHIDPTKCPHPFDPQELVSWTVELERFCEQTRRAAGVRPVDYEVGAEDIQGGLTAESAFEGFLAQLTQRLSAAGLPLPTCIVGQTGTLTRLDRNVGRFDRRKAAGLAAIAARHGIGFKEHNTDYLSAASCRLHPELGITGANVAPEFGLAETDALLQLCQLEEKLPREGWLAEGQDSGFRELLLRKSFEQTPWLKWVTPEIKALPRERVAGDGALRALIGRVCGHYLAGDAELSGARATLLSNVDRHRLLPGEAAAFVKDRVKEAIAFYVEHFRMAGVNRRL
jgi:D-tagatose-1,6-bisphosphate aldolase subunit GatZ/KbaZ